MKSGFPSITRDRAREGQACDDGASRRALPRTLADLPPLWKPPKPLATALGHNGGPPLEPRRAGRPTKLTPAVQDAIMDALLDGVPERAICAVAGFPHRTTLRSWRTTRPAFARAFAMAQHEGWAELAHAVFDEVERLLDSHGTAHARRVFSLRQWQLARQARSYFKGSGVRW